MKRAIAATIVLASLSMGFQTGQPRGMEIAVFTADEGKLKGEVLAVRDTALVFVTPAWLSEEGLAAGRGKIRVIPFSRIVDVTTVTGSYALEGLLGGMTLGCFVGALIGSATDVEQKPNDTFGCNAASERADNQATGALIGGLGGAAVGVMVGGSISETGASMIGPQYREFGILKGFARYPSGEPAYIKAFAQ